MPLVDSDSSWAAHVVMPAYPHIDSAFGNWLAGFIDGEGCFLIKQSEACRFELALRADDRAMLEEICEHTGIGMVRAMSRPDHLNPAYRWYVLTKADCVRLVEILDAFPLRAKKRRDYEIWREALFVWSARVGDWRTEMLRLYGELCDGRRFSSEGESDEQRSSPTSTQLELVA